MDAANGPADLQVRQDLGFQRREWRSSRLLWTVVLALMAATALGLFGRGLLSRAEDASGALRIEYERFARYGAAIRLTVHLAQAGAPRELVLDYGYLRAMHVSSIVPAPIAEQPAEGGVLFRFAPSSSRTLEVQFDMQPVRRFNVRGTIQSGSQAITFWQFVYP